MRGASTKFGLCGPECTYRSLYEGSQRSLSDMAAKQSVALSRVARLRTGVVAALKQTFPVEFSDAERVLGRRMSATDDEVLLAYLSGFLAMPQATSAASAASSAARPHHGGAGLSELRGALAQCGVVLPAGDDPREWAAAVHRWGGASGTRPQVAVSAPPGADRAPEVFVSDDRVVHPVEGDGPADGDAAGVADGTWDDVFGGDLPPEPAPEPDTGGDLGLFDEDLLPPLVTGPAAPGSPATSWPGSSTTPRSFRPRCRRRS